MKALRVLHLVHNFPPEFEGGTERHVAELVRCQQRDGLEVRVACGSERRSETEPRVEVEDFHGVEVHRLLRRREDDFAVPFRPRGLRGPLARLAGEAEVLHLHHWFNLGEQLLQRLPRRPTVVSFHDAFAACPRFFLLRPDGGWCGGGGPVPLERCVRCVAVDDGEAELPTRLQDRRSSFEEELRRIDVAVAPSRFHARCLESLGLFEPGRVRVLPLGIAAPAVTPAGGDRRPGPLRLVCFGNLSRLKGVDLLLKAVRSLREPTAVEVHLMGRLLAADEAALRAEAEGLPVHFHGPYGPGQIAALDADLAVFPSRAHETYSLVVEEARALRLPMIVSDRGALPERLGEAGCAVPVEDERALGAELQRAVDQPGEWRRRKDAMDGRFARVDDAARTLETWYRSAMDGGGPNADRRSETSGTGDRA